MDKAVTKEKIRRIRKYIEWRNSFNSIVQRTLHGIKSFDQLFVITMAVLIGVASGYVAAGFRILIDFFRGIMWENGHFTDVIRQSPVYMRFLIPAAGGTIVALFVNRYAREAKGHGVPEVMEAVALRNGYIRMRVVLVKALASAISIGSGAAVGREGPIVQIGSALGSTVSQIFQVSAQRAKTFLACGAAAGIAATFNAPIAGAIFASEVILGDFSVAAIGPIIIASVFGTVISRSIYGNYPAFVPPVYTLHSPVEYIFYIILGVAAGIVGWLFVRSLYRVEDFFDDWKAPIAVKAFSGGLALGMIALIVPQVMGIGYESMDDILTGKIPLLLALTLMFGKIFATSLSLGYGASGGIFAPSLYIGSMLGGTLGSIFHGLFPNQTASPGAYALVGMAAMVAAATHAPITAILIIFEMTTEYSVILPLMISSILATVITTHVLEGNIYTIKLLRRGINIHGGADINILNRLEVGKIKQQLVEVIREDMKLGDLLEKMSKSDQQVFYVCDRDDKLTGVITQGMVRRFLNQMEEIPVDETVKTISNTHFPRIDDNVPINEVLRLMLDNDMMAVPVVDKEGKLTGQVLRPNILRKYQDMLIQMQNAEQLAASMKYVHQHYHEKMEVIPGFLMVRINTPSEFVNKTVEGLNLRKKYHVDILLIRKAVDDGYEDQLPEPHIRLGQDDQLLIFGKKNDVESVCDFV